MTYLYFYMNFWYYSLLWRMDTLLTSDCKQRLLLGNAHNRRTVFSVVCTTAISGKQLSTHVSVATDVTATEDRCFLCGP
jgi:hypothetical protein